MTFHTLVSIAATLWLASLCGCVLAIRLSWLSVPQRLWTAVILSVTTLALSCLGIARFQVVASKTVNGQLQWRLDSRWFFIMTFLLSAFTLAYTLWKQKNRTHAS